MGWRLGGPGQSNEDCGEAGTTNGVKGIEGERWCCRFV